MTAINTAAPPSKTKLPRGKIHELAVDQISDDPALQPRQQMDLDIIREYSAAWLEGANFPPVEVYFDGEDYWLADGFYRVRSARKAGLSAIHAVVYEGTKRDALIHSLGANAIHGVRRTIIDKRKAIVTMLNDEEWCLWSNAEIGRACKVSASLVAQIRKGSPGLKGHGVQARLGKDGRVNMERNSEDIPESVDRRTFQRPPVLMTRTEIVDKYERRLLKHIKKTEPDAERNVEYRFGTIEIVSPKTLYAIAIISDRHSLYTVAGRMIVAREALKSKASIVIIGHFPRSVAGIIQVLSEELGIQCLTPEQILSS
jgi:hypothetical protein